MNTTARPNGTLDPAAFDRVLQPIATATGLPNAAYTSEDYGVLERDLVLARTWTCIGVAAQVPEPGDVRPVDLLGLPLVLLRDRDGEVRVFHNVCSHRGMRLVDRPRKVRSTISCPYHCWTYGLDGQLEATPHIGGSGKSDCPGFDRSKHGLKPVRSGVWADAVFVNLSGDAPALSHFVAPLAERWSAFDLSAFRHGGPDSRFELELACNWKLAVENYCEGYHLPWIHPKLNRYSRLEDHYNIEQDGHYAGQGSRAYRPRHGKAELTFPTQAGLPNQWYGAAEYLALFPNVLFGVHADHLCTVCLIPETASKTREVYEIYYAREESLGDDFAELRQANRKQWLKIFEEDRFVVEGMQRGRASPAYAGGAFSPVMDTPTHCFHKWEASAMVSALASGGG
jgi:choline monooxygenase